MRRRLLRDSGIGDQGEVEMLVREADELVAILNRLFQERVHDRPKIAPDLPLILKHA
jgi:hypothetical protein